MLSNPQGEELIRSFAGDWTVICLEPGQVLFEEGEPADYMYMVRSGTIRVSGGGVVFEDIGPGGILGEMGLIEKDAGRSATACALDEAELVRIDEKRFLLLIAHAPEFAMTVMRVLSERLRNMNRRYGKPGASPETSPDTPPETPASPSLEPDSAGPQKQGQATE